MQRRNYLALVLLATAGTAFAQAYPAKPIKLLVPFAPGGTTDIIARAIADPLGNVIMRYDEAAEMRGVHKDLERLLKYSWIH